MMTHADNDILLRVRVGAQHYVARRDQLEYLSLIDPAESFTDSFGRPIVCRELLPLLSGTEPAAAYRRHALMVNIRRRSVMLLVDHIDSLVGVSQQAIQPLDALLSNRLARPWFLGAIIIHAEVLLVLDLRRIARDIAMGSV